MNLFGFIPQKHKVRTEIIAGLTSFLTMAYILAVNPSIFSAIKDMPSGAVFTATALSAIIGCLLMAFYAKKPIGVAPGMGPNVFFVFTVCLAMGHTWQFALTALLVEGLLFFILSATKICNAIANAIPGTLRNAIGAGIGLFIAFVGLQGAGIVVDENDTLLALGNLGAPTAILFIVGLFVISACVILKVPGSILVGLIITTLVGIPLGLTQFNGVMSMPSSVEPIFCQFEWGSLWTKDMIIVVVSFLLLDMFSAIGTLIGVFIKSGVVSADDKVDDMDRMLVTGTIATTAGACFGTSNTTPFVESATGVAMGGRTGLTAFVIAIGFIVALFFSPLFLAIPTAATGAVLVIVGVMMMEPVAHIDWDNFPEAIPAFITMVMMPMTYSISHGIMLGMISYVVLNALTGKFKKISWMMWILAVAFVCSYVFL